MKQRTIHFHAENCIECHACEAACKSWRNTEPGVNLRKITPVWQGTFPTVASIPVSQACVHCSEPACAIACPPGIIEKKQNSGLVLLDSDECTGCRACFHACPVAAPQFGTNGKMLKCDLCYEMIPAGTFIPPCVSTCPTKALELA